MLIPLLAGDSLDTLQYKTQLKLPLKTQNQPS